MACHLLSDHKQSRKRSAVESEAHLKSDATTKDETTNILESTKQARRENQSSVTSSSTNVIPILPKIKRKINVSRLFGFECDLDDALSQLLLFELLINRKQESKDAENQWPWVKRMDSVDIQANELLMKWHLKRVDELRHFDSSNRKVYSDNSDIVRFVLKNCKRLEIASLIADAGIPRTPLISTSSTMISLLTSEQVSLVSPVSPVTPLSSSSSSSSSTSSTASNATSDSNATSESVTVEWNTIYNTWKEICDVSKLWTRARKISYITNLVEDGIIDDALFGSSNDERTELKIMCHDPENQELKGTTVLIGFQVPFDTLGSTSDSILTIPDNEFVNGKDYGWVFSANWRSIPLEPSGMKKSAWDDACIPSMVIRTMMLMEIFNHPYIDIHDALWWNVISSTNE